MLSYVLKLPALALNIKMYNRQFTSNSGFTIIEILVIVIITLILAAIVLPKFFDVENKNRQITIQQNMKIVELAVKAYAVDNKGKYPLSPDDQGFKSFFPGGNCNTKNPQGGNYPENPFTHLNEAPLPGNIVDIKQARQSPPIDLGGPRVSGKIFYNAIVPSQTKETIGYAIEGADKNGIAMPGFPPDLTYVLSNL